MELDGKRTGRRARTVLALVAALAVTVGCQSTRSGGRDATSPTVAAPPEATQPNPPPIPAARASFRFDQILGVPTNKQDDLATEIARYAKGAISRWSAAATRPRATASSASSRRSAATPGST